MADLVLRDVAVETGDVFWPAERGGDTAILGWNTHDAGSINLKNPTKDETLTYEVADIHLGWFDLGGWKEIFGAKTFQLDPGAETKIAVSEGAGKSVTNKGWKKVANVGDNTPSAPPPVFTDWDTFVEAVTKNLWIVVVVIVVLAILAFAAVWSLGGGQGIAALHGVMS